jgi:hypothetical protein
MSQKKLVVLSLFMVVFGAVALNEFVIRKSDADQNRDLASFAERFQPEQIKWEQELARSVAQDPNRKTLIGAKPSLSDKFMYEVLQGRYETVLSSGQLVKISLRPQQSPIEFDVTRVIKQYSSLFRGATKIEVQSGTGVLLLKNSKGESVGQAAVQRNDEGRITLIEVR